MKTKNGNGDVIVVGKNKYIRHMILLDVPDVKTPFVGRVAQVYRCKIQQQEGGE
jgi:hypothetical protein